MMYKRRTSVSHTDMCSDQKETTWSVGESRTMQCLMLEVPTLLWVWLGKRGQKHQRLLYTLLGRKLLSTAKNSTLDLSKHLASRHKNVKLTEKTPDPTTDMTAAATTSNSTGRTSEDPSPAKQVKLDLRATGFSAAELEKLVTGYIVEDMLSISTVDSESLRCIV